MPVFPSYSLCSKVLQQTISVGSGAAVALPTSPLANRRFLIVQNLTASTPVYLGSSTVTSTGATQGVALANQYDTLQINIEQGLQLYAITNSGTATVAILEGV